MIQCKKLPNSEEWSEAMPKPPEELAAAVDDKLEKLRNMISAALEGKEGMYVRLATVEERIESLENNRDNNPGVIRLEAKVEQLNKLIWWLLGLLAALGVAVVIQFIKIAGHEK